MAQSKVMFKRAPQGFTLIELLLVMVILVILAGVVVLRFGNSQDTAKHAAAVTDISNLGTAIQTFKIAEGRFPTTEEGLQALLVRPSNATAAASNWPFIEKLPLDPWKQQYIYRCPPTAGGADYDLLSSGPDLHEGGGDDITNW